jgi:hypothetical protein
MQLHKQIEPNIFAALQAAIDRIESSVQRFEHGRLVELSSGHSRQATWRPDAVEMSNLHGWVERAIPGNSGLRPWLQLGIALGELQCVQGSKKAGRKKGVIRDEISALPKFFRERVPVLAAFVTNDNHKQSSLARITQLTRKLPPDDEPLTYNPEGSAGVRFMDEIVRGLRECPEQPSALDPRDDARNKWIYDHCLLGTSHKEIRTALRQRAKEHEWRMIESPSGINKAARQYARRNNLRPPLPRPRGRTSRGN